MSEIRPFVAVDIMSGRRPAPPTGTGASGIDTGLSQGTAGAQSFGSSTSVGGGANSSYGLSGTRAPVDLSANAGGMGVYQAKEPPTLNKPGQFHEQDKAAGLTSDSIKGKQDSGGDSGKGGIFGAIGNAIGGALGDAAGDAIGGLFE